MTVDLEELERLATAATPGPWHRGQGPHWAREVRGSTGRGVAWCGSQGYEADAAFIAAAGEAVPALCAELRGARERIAELEADVDALRSRTECGGRTVDLTDPNDACQSARVQAARAEAAEKRVAELEARPEFGSCPSCGGVFDELAHCETVVKDTLDKWATKTHPDGVYHFVAWADIADLIARERAAAREQALEEAMRCASYTCACAARIRALKAVKP
jgi:hypothetical protein